MSSFVGTARAAFNSLSHSGMSSAIPSATVTAITFTEDLAATLGGLSATLPATPDPPCGAGSSLTGSAGDTLLTFSGATLAEDATCTFSVTVNVPGTASSGTFTNTTSTVSAAVGTVSVTAPAASDDLQVSSLNFTKEFTDDPVLPGGTVTLRFTIENTSATTAAAITFFTDNLGAFGGTLPGLAATGPPIVNTCGGTLSGTTSLIYIGGSVPASTTCSIEVPVLVPAGAPSGTFTNTTSALISSFGTTSPATDALIVEDAVLLFSKEFTDDPVADGT